MDTAKSAAPGNLTQAVLEGGPETIPESQRAQLVNAHDAKIKIPHYGGYEHFERNGESHRDDRHQPATFHWTMRTEIAE
jgi:Family of unknown function (DUF5988)